MQNSCIMCQLINILVLYLPRSIISLVLLFQNYKPLAIFCGCMSKCQKTGLLVTWLNEHLLLLIDYMRHISVQNFRFLTSTGRYRQTIYAVDNNQAALLCRLFCSCCCCFVCLFFFVCVFLCVLFLSLLFWFQNLSREVTLIFSQINHDVG